MGGGGVCQPQQASFALSLVESALERLQTEPPRPPRSPVLVAELLGEQYAYAIRIPPSGGDSQPTDILRYLGSHLPYDSRTLGSLGVLSPVLYANKGAEGMRLRTPSNVMAFASAHLARFPRLRLHALAPLAFAACATILERGLQHTH